MPALVATSRASRFMVEGLQMASLGWERNIDWPNGSLDSIFEALAFSRISVYGVSWLAWYLTAVLLPLAFDSG